MGAPMQRRPTWCRRRLFRRRPTTRSPGWSSPSRSSLPAASRAGRGKRPRPPGVSRAEVHKDGKKKVKEATMGLLDDVLSMAGMGNAAQSQQHAGVLGMLLGYISSPQVGGISGLQQMFQQKGLGNLVSSWIGNGQNLPISADQLQNVLHGGALENIATQSGMNMGQISSLLSQMLPHLVDKLTPNGQVPDAGALSQMMKGFAAGRGA